MVARIIMIIFGGFGIMLLYVSTTRFFQQRRLMANAIKVKAVITYSQVFASPESATEELKPFPVGATVDAYVDPGLPDKAFLVKESSVGPVVFILVGLLVPPLAWWVSKFI